MVGQASSLSIENDGQDARRHQILFLFAITSENPYRIRFAVTLSNDVNSRPRLPIVRKDTLENRVSASL